MEIVQGRPWGWSHCTFKAPTPSSLPYSTLVLAQLTAPSGQPGGVTSARAIRPLERTKASPPPTTQTEEAILDTGAPFTVVDEAWARRAGLVLSPTARTFDIAGQSYRRVQETRCNVKLIALHGESIVLHQVIAFSVFGWDQIPLLGVEGCLNKIRFAFDSVTEASTGKVRFYFSS
jgi:hypothetical protein